MISTRAVNFILRNQGRPIRDNLFDFRPATGKSGHAGRAGQNQRRNFFGESFNRFAIIAAHADAQLNFRQIWRRLAGQWSMRRVSAHEFRQDLIELQAQPIEPWPAESCPPLQLLHKRPARNKPEFRPLCILPNN